MSRRKSDLDPVKGIALTLLIGALLWCAGIAAWKVFT